jgi:hypothetical protein
VTEITPGVPRHEVIRNRITFEETMMPPTRDEPVLCGEREKRRIGEERQDFQNRVPS